MSPAAATPITFAEIVEEELQQEAALIRSREKPLALIQVKENVIWCKVVLFKAIGVAILCILLTDVLMVLLTCTPSN